MAVYKIFSEKDTTAYSAFPDQNTGVDPILEVYNLFPDELPSPRVARALIKFDNDEAKTLINTTISSSIVSGSDWQSYLKLYIAEASGIDQENVVEVRLVSGSWNNGAGMYNDVPKQTNGASWNWRRYYGSGPWTNQAIRNSPGPGYTQLTQSWGTGEVKDLCINVTTASAMIHNNLLSMGQDSYLVKLTGSQEFISGSLINQPHFKFFSRDTNTIYTPYLEFRWDDSSYETGSLNVINTSDLFIGLDTNPGVYYSESINMFRLNVRPEFPARVYQTQSLYTTNHALPAASYYAIKDADTNEFIVEFDTLATKISCDSTGSFFNVYMNGLQPERYYKLLFKTTIGNQTIVKDEDYLFKVVNG